MPKPAIRIKKSRSGFNLFKKYGPWNGGVSEEYHWNSLPQDKRDFWNDIAKVELGKEKE